MEHLKALTNTIPTLRSKKSGEYIELYTNTYEEYRSLNHILEQLNYQYVVIKPKGQRPIKIVIKGQPKDTNTDDIKNNFIELVFTIDKVTQLIGRITKQTLPVFLVTLPRNLDNFKIFYITKLCYLTIRIEGYDGKGVTQCNSCNKFHHTAENCPFTLSKRRISTPDTRLRYQTDPSNILH
ncbi:nucleic-acid-binding protein from transposon X-element [Trichonephila clavipes]|nr:nucleic-acid-binding protein from transposon X-element [Trichonephila clavipes]